VEVIPVQISTQEIVVYAMGTVQPAQEVALHPRLNGEIISVSQEFVPGGFFKKGQTILQIDPKDYQLFVRQRESDVALAKSDLAIELGQQSVARQEYELLGEAISKEDQDLVLRQPQLEKVRATLMTAQAALEQARINLERTAVKAPFNATVRSREVDLGTQVTTSTLLANLTGTDKYWIQAAVPIDQLKWIHIPRSSNDSGSAVRILNEAAWGAETSRNGEVVRLLNTLEEEGRMAQLLVTVHDPMSLEAANTGKPPLILNDYVRVEIQGIELEAVAAVDRQWIRNGDQVWIMNDKGQLEIRPVEIAFYGRDQIFIRSGLADGELLVTTDLAVPVEGLPLRTPDDNPPTEPSSHALPRPGR